MQYLPIIMQYLPIIVSAVTLLFGGGILTSLYKSFRLRQEEIQIRYFQSFQEFDARYFNFLNLCVSNPDAYASIHQEDIPDDTLSREGRAKRLIIYDYVIAMLESAYIYKDRNKVIAERRWPLWENFFRSYLKRRSFEEYFHTAAQRDLFDLDPRFREHLMNVSKNIGNLAA